MRSRAATLPRGIADVRRPQPARCREVSGLSEGHPDRVRAGAGRDGVHPTPVAALRRGAHPHCEPHGELFVGVQPAGMRGQVDCVRQSARGGGSAVATPYLMSCQHPTSRWFAISLPFQSSFLEQGTL